MKRAGRILLAVGIVLAQSGIFVQPSFALDAVSTPDEQWLQSPALVISAYQRSAAGDTLQLLELFNESDQLVAIEDWAIADESSSGRGELQLGYKGSSGLIPPKSHVSIEFPEGPEITNASFVATGWEDGDKVTVLSKVSVSSKEPGVKQQLYELKTSPTATKGIEKYDDYWRRTPLTTPGYTSTLSSFSVTSPMTVYDDGLYIRPPSPAVRVVEVLPYAEDCAPTSQAVKCYDYIKLSTGAMSGDELAHYVLRTDNSSSSRTDSNTFYLADYAPKNGYVTIGLTSEGEPLSLTNSGGYIWLEDLYEGFMFDATLTAYAAAGTDHQGWSYMQDLTGGWKWTYSPTPDGDNLFSEPVVHTEVTVCPAGKYLNPDTGRCRTLEEAINTLAACGEGEYRNPETNRCKKIAATASTVTLVACGEGQERNPVTNRCRSIASAVAELLPCDEGYERNPATNRCKKVLAAATTSSLPVGGVTETTTDSSAITTMLGWVAVGVVALGALGYAAYEWRTELAGAWTALLSHGKK